MQARGVVKVLACAEADEAVVGLAVLLLDKVHVVGGYQLDIVFLGKLHQVAVHQLLPMVGVGGGIGLVGLVALHLKVEIVAEQVLEPDDSLLGTLEVGLHYLLRYLAADAGRAAYQPLVVLLQQVVVDARMVEESFGEGYRAELAQVLVALLVLGQQYEVPAAAVGDAVAARFGVALFHGGVLVVERAVGAVGLDAYYGLEKLPVECGKLGVDGGGLFLQVAQAGRPFGHLGVRVQLLDLLYFCLKLSLFRLQLLYFVLHLAVLLLDGVHQLLDAEHIAVVGQGHSIHPVAFAFAD